MLHPVFQVTMLRMPSNKPQGNIDDLMLFLIRLINWMQVAATGGAAKDFVGHLIFNDRQEALVELEEVVDLLFVVLSGFFEVDNLLFALLHDLVQAVVLLEEVLHGRWEVAEVVRWYGLNFGRY
jgi:hypothetical protein